MTAPRRDEGCIFCNAGAAGPSEELLTLHRDDTSLVMLNRYPYTNGHLMVAPRRHTARLTDSTDGELLAMMRLAATAQRFLSDIYSPDGFNIGMNFGESAGAGVADHYHLHVVPRWKGDANFMSVTAQTRMVPEELSTTFRRLRPMFESLG